MKKLMLLVVFAVGCLLYTNAQNDTVLYIENYQNGDRVPICVEKYQRVLLYAEDGCDGFTWYMYEAPNWDNPLVVETQVEETRVIRYNGCNLISDFVIRLDFKEGRVPAPFNREIWKRSIETDSLVAVGHDSIDYPFNYYRFLWSTGETTRTINVTEPGTYTCEIQDPCGTATRTFIVRDNVEISLATCDLETNLNMVTWPTTPAQAEYVSQVEVKRDGLVVGTAAYSDGYFIDNIGSDAASRTYTVTALATDGAPCPIASYPKETIHMAYLTGINNTIEVNWNQPTGYDLLGYNICEWHPGAKDGDLTVIDYVGAGVTSYTCSESMFDEGNIVVQGVEAGKDGESRLLSNRSWETVGIGEHQNKFNVYPNPTNGTFTVDGTTELTVFNTLGQTVTTSHSENGTHTFTLRSGIYFIKSDEGTVQKIVVE